MKSRFVKHKTEHNGEQRVTPVRTIVSSIRKRWILFRILWALTELIIFISTLIMTDLSFDSLDMGDAMVNARTSLDSDVEASQTSSTSGMASVTSEPMSSISVLGGSLDSPSEYCGPPGGSTYYRYINVQTIMDFTRTRREEPGPTVVKAEEGEKIVIQGSNELLDFLMCRQHVPILDQRNILASLSQPCKHARLILPNSTGLLHFCSDLSKHRSKMTVIGAKKKVCFFVHRREDRLAEEGWSSLICYQLGPNDLRSPELQWILPRLWLVWSRIKASAILWAVLSVLMRVIYWWRVIQVAKRSLVHIVSDGCVPPRCASESPTRDRSSKKDKHGEEERKIRGPPSITQCDEPLTTASSRRQREKRDHQVETLHEVNNGGRSRHHPAERGDNTVCCGPNDERMEALALGAKRVPKVTDLLTATCIGISCANSDPSYLMIAVLRQTLGSAYSEILISVITTAQAAWQALGIVIYHQAIILLLAKCSSKLGRRRAEQRIIQTTSDVSVLGYISFCLLLVVAQGNQLLNWDFLYLFTLATWINQAAWWLVYPANGPDGASVFTRGDNTTHTLAAVYTFVLALIVKAVSRALFRKARGQEPVAETKIEKKTASFLDKGKQIAPCRGAEETTTKPSNSLLPSYPQKAALHQRWCDAFSDLLPPVRCPQCRAFIIMQPTVILSSRPVAPASDATKVASIKRKVVAVGPQPVAPVVVSTILQQQPPWQRNTRETERLGGEESPPTVLRNCCLLRRCSHPIFDTIWCDANDYSTNFSRYRFCHYRSLKLKDELVSS